VVRQRLLDQSLVQAGGRTYERKLKTKEGREWSRERVRRAFLAEMKFMFHENGGRLK